MSRADGRQDETQGLKEYPKMMYHVAKEPTIADSPDEEARLLSGGWETRPVAFSEEALLDAKIAETEALLAGLKKKRRDLAASASAPSSPSAATRDASAPRGPCDAPKRRLP
ncbi:MAG: hypothetical protein ABSC19_05005 [Syntrophorhabdales bacterium]|jgi:hypothetical protein